MWVLQHGISKRSSHRMFSSNLRMLSNCFRMGPYLEQCIRKLTSFSIQLLQSLHIQFSLTIPCHLPISISKSRHPALSLVIKDRFILLFILKIYDSVQNCIALYSSTCLLRVTLCFQFVIKFAFRAVSVSFDSNYSSWIKQFSCLISSAVNLIS